MAVRVRADGRILCAAMHPAEPGDDYIPDNVSEKLSGATGILPPVLVTEEWELPPGVGRGGHSVHGEWWWRDAVPDDAVIVDWWLRQP